MLRAVDMQQIVTQLEQAEKVHRVEQRHPEMQQRYLELQAKEEQRLRQKKVPDAEEARKTSIKDKREREERERRAGADRRASVRQAIKGEEEQDAPQQVGHINIKV